MFNDRSATTFYQFTFISGENKWYIHLTCSLVHQTDEIKTNNSFYRAHITVCNRPHSIESIIIYWKKKKKHQTKFQFVLLHKRKWINEYEISFNNRAIDNNKCCYVLFYDMVGGIPLKLSECLPQKFDNRTLLFLQFQWNGLHPFKEWKRV